MRRRTVRRRAVIALGAGALCCVLGLMVVHQVGAAQEREAVYVGARVCGTCHQGAGMGHQLSRWLLSNHARAYAVLSSPDSARIAELSGIIQEPQESAVCLGCHATGSDAEEWEKDPTFFIEDGVQCEMCHGAGSEYIDVEVMSDPGAAMRAGLRKITERDCMVCHAEKGSHVAIHNKSQLDVSAAFERIAHPTPEAPSYDPIMLGASGPGGVVGAAVAAESSAPGPKYAGVFACAECHDSPSTGLQFSIWRMSRHAQAYATLSTPAAYETAERRGLEVPPQESPECLRCHSTAGLDEPDAYMASLSKDEGVGCEACHGAGSEYLDEAIMRDAVAARAAGLRPVTEETCKGCHESESFDFAESFEKIAHPVVHTTEAAAADAPAYKTPINLAISPDGREIYVACEASDSVVIVDARNKRNVAEVAVGRQATDVAFDPSGSRAFVSNKFDDTVSVIDVATREVTRTFPVGDDPHGVLTDRSGSRLYVLNTTEDSISVVDLQSYDEIKRLRASRRPWSLDLSPDGSTFFVTNALSRFVEVRTPSMTEVTVLDSERDTVRDRIVVPAANILQGVAWHPDGEYALVTLNRTKNLVPMTRLLQGWTITNGIGIVWRDGRVDQVLLDEPDMSFPDPSDLAITPDGRLALVTSSGSDRVAVVDVEKLVAMLEEAPDYDREHVFPNHLGKPAEFVITHIPTGKSPRAVVIAPDGATAFVADALDDTLTVIDLETLTATDTIDLGGSKEITQVRWGEQLFHSADITFHRQFSCHTCHPDGHVDGITYDIEPDGLGVSPVDNRTLRGILDTAPFKWEGTNPSLSRQCGPRLAVFFTRVEPFTPTELEALTTYIATIPRPPNRHRPLGAPLTEAQRRGKKMFARTMANDGRVIPVEGRCITCHPAPLYTDRSVRDVGTRMPLDREALFDVPHLTNIYDSAPYLHNGASETLEEIWTRFNPNDQHGVTNDMTKDQLNDLIEFLKTL
jgi:YVTN family beta-propeller protein